MCFAFGTCRQLLILPEVMHLRFVPTMNLLRRFTPTTSHFRSASVTATAVPRVFPATGFKPIPASNTLEEENWPWYTPESFYPVRIGDVVHSKYQVLYKLGYGTTATTWMCRDLQQVPLFFFLKKAEYL